MVTALSVAGCVERPLRLGGSLEEPNVAWGAAFPLTRLLTKPHKELFCDRTYNSQTRGPTPHACFRIQVPSTYRVYRPHYTYSHHGRPASTCRVSTQAIAAMCITYLVYLFRKRRR